MPPAVALLAYPLRGEGGALLAVWTVLLYGMVYVLHAATGVAAVDLIALLLVMIAFVFLFGIFLLYAWASLRHASSGHVAPMAAIELEEVHPLTNYLGLQVAALLMLVAGGIDAGFSVSIALGTVLAVMAAAVLPALLGVMVLEERFIAALDLHALKSFVSALGIVYPGFAGAIYVAVAAVYAAILTMQSPSLVAVAGASYLFVLGHVLAGRVLYLRSEALAPADHFEVLSQTVAHDLDPARAIEGLLVDLHRLCGVDRIDAADRQLEAFLTHYGHDLDEQIHQRLLRFQDQRLLLTHGWHYLDRLVARHKTGRGWQLLRHCLTQDALFRPGSGEVVLSLVAAAPPADAHLVTDLLADFERAYPSHPQLPQALELRARWLAQELGRDGEAVALLIDVERRFPVYATAPGFQSLLMRLRRLTAPPSS
ncbi:MAG: hypothetical protein HC809_04705 [Gammaproteobacteria bacterium]|nr:hypothetical protein [Gammaproteobacteria bacterium]